MTTKDSPCAQLRRCKFGTPCYYYHIYGTDCRFCVRKREYEVIKPNHIGDSVVTPCGKGYILDWRYDANKIYYRHVYSGDCWRCEQDLKAVEPKRLDQYPREVLSEDEFYKVLNCIGEHLILRTKEYAASAVTEGKILVLIFSTVIHKLKQYVQSFPIPIHQDFKDALIRILEGEPVYSYKACKLRDRLAKRIDKVCLDYIAEKRLHFG